MVAIELPPKPGTVVAQDTIVQVQPEQNSVTVLDTVRVQYKHATKPGTEPLPAGATAPKPAPLPIYHLLLQRPVFLHIIFIHVVEQFCFDGYILHIQQWS